MSAYYDYPQCCLLLISSSCSSILQRIHSSTVDFLWIISFSPIVFLRAFVELSCSMYKDSCLNGFVAEKLYEYYHSLSTITVIPRGLGTIILIMGLIMTVGLLPLPLSPMFIQSTEATTTTTTGVPECFGGPPTIV